MHEQYFFNRRFQISLIVNRDRWAHLEGSARAEHHTDSGSRIRSSSAERTACSCSRFRCPVHKKVRRLSCQGRQRPHRCGIELRSERIKGMSDADIYNSIAHGTQHKEYPHAFLHTGLTEEQIQGQSMKRLPVISYLKIICRKHSRKSRESCLIHFLTRKNETSGQLRTIRRSIK